MVYTHYNIIGFKCNLYLIRFVIDFSVVFIILSFFNKTTRDSEKYDIIDSIILILFGLEIWN